MRIQSLICGRVALARPRAQAAFKASPELQAALKQFRERWPPRPELTGFYT